jgi:hypothetical protein
MTDHKLSISGPPHSPAVHLDGHNLSRALRALSIRFEAGHLPKVEAELAICEIDVASMGVRDSEIVISMSDAVREALIELGWTPPEHHGLLIENHEPGSPEDLAARKRFGLDDRAG